MRLTQFLLGAVTMAQATKSQMLLPDKFETLSTLTYDSTAKPTTTFSEKPGATHYTAKAVHIFDGTDTVHAHPTTSLTLLSIPAGDNSPMTVHSVHTLPEEENRITKCSTETRTTNIADEITLMSYVSCTIYPAVSPTAQTPTASATYPNTTTGSFNDTDTSNSAHTRSTKTFTSVVTAQASGSATGIDGQGGPANPTQSSLADNILGEPLSPGLVLLLLFTLGFLTGAML